MILQTRPTRCLLAFGLSIGLLACGDGGSSGDNNAEAEDPGPAEPISLVSKNSLGFQGDATTQDGSISTDGRYVAYSSDSTNLVVGDTNGEADTFVRDIDEDDTVRISVAADGSQANDFSQITGMSGDGRYVLFYSTASNLDPAANNMISQLFRAPAQ